VAEATSAPAWQTLIWLAFRGSAADRMRVYATATVTAAAMCIVLSTASVAVIGDGDGPYPFALLTEPGLRRGLLLGLALFVGLLGALAGQCSRIGAPDRDRRLASYRLSGATPNEVATLVGVETTLASGLGALCGATFFFIAKPLVNDIVTVEGSFTRERQVSDDTVIFEKAYGQVHLLPTDVHLSWWIAVLALVGLPLLVGGASRVALRRVVISPFGVVRREAVRTPRIAPAMLFLGGTGALVFLDSVRARLALPPDASRPVIAVVVVAALCSAAGLLGGTAAIAKYLGEALAPRTSAASTLIAARRLAAQPYAASRANSVVLLVALVAGFIQGTRAFVLTTTSESENPFYGTTVDVVNAALLVGIGLAALGVLVTTGETVVSARRSFSAMTAAGVPRGILRRSLLLEALMPLALTIPVAVLAGEFAARGVFGTRDSRSLGTVAHERIVVVEVPIPWQSLVTVAVSMLLAAAVMAWIALSFVDESTDPSELRTSA
jgi:hypothetical protein